MIENVPVYIKWIFALTTLCTLFLFYKMLSNAYLERISTNATKITVALTSWLAMQALFSLQNIYSASTTSLPPTIFLLGVLPALLVILILFISKKGRQFIDSLPLQYYTLIHIMRIPVELVLWWLFLNRCVPEIMTFEGRNFDILAGLSAPFIAYFGFVKRKIGSLVILVWNVICLALLLNIVVIGILSAPSPLQKLAFEQPNIAVLYFPFSWLVSFVVPIILLGHLTSIRQLWNERK
jgi:hypothetical protein